MRGGARRTGVAWREREPLRAFGPSPLKLTSLAGVVALAGPTDTVPAPSTSTSGGGAGPPLACRPPAASPSWPSGAATCGGADADLGRAVPSRLCTLGVLLRESGLGPMTSSSSSGSSSHHGTSSTAGSAPLAATESSCCSAFLGTGLQPRRSLGCSV